MTVDPILAVQNHAAHSNEYFENALIALQNREAGKAGELLWGSVAQALEAVATFNDLVIRSHRELKNFAIQLSRELDDETLKIDFILAESLHHNFYDVQQDSSDIEMLVPTVQELVKKLIALIPPQYLSALPSQG
jgi:hypothetical protein